MVAVRLSRDKYQGSADTIVLHNLNGTQCW